MTEPLQKTTPNADGASELDAFIANAAKPRPRARYETIYSQIPLCEVALTRAAHEATTRTHYAHAHANPDGTTQYAKLEQRMVCRACNEVIPYAARKRITSGEGARDDEKEVFFLNQSHEAEREDKETGITLEGNANMAADSERIKEIFFLEPRRYTTKKDKRKDEANYGAVLTLCDYARERPLRLAWRGRECILTGTRLMVLYANEEMNDEGNFARELAKLKGQPCTQNDAVLTAIMKR